MWPVQVSCWAVRRLAAKLVGWKSLCEAPWNRTVLGDPALQAVAAERKEGPMWSRCDGQEDMKVGFMHQLTGPQGPQIPGQTFF